MPKKKILYAYTYKGERIKVLSTGDILNRDGSINTYMKVHGINPTISWRTSLTWYGTRKKLDAGKALKGYLRFIKKGHFPMTERYEKTKEMVTIRRIQ